MGGYARCKPSRIVSSHSRCSFDRAFVVACSPSAARILARSAVLKVSWSRWWQSILGALEEEEDEMFVSGSASRVWKPDSASAQCDACGCGFSFTVRRHHCRYDGTCKAVIFTPSLLLLVGV